MAHMNIAIAMKKEGRTNEACAQEAYVELCGHIPDLFDYVNDEEISGYTVKEFKTNKNILSEVYAYFTPYDSYNKDLSEESIDNGLLYGLDEDDYIFIIDCHN